MSTLFVPDGALRTRSPSQMASSATFSTSGTRVAPRVEASSATSVTGTSEDSRSDFMRFCGSSRRPLARSTSALAMSRTVRRLGSKVWGSLPAGMSVVTWALGPATCLATSPRIGVVATTFRLAPLPSSPAAVLAQLLRAADKAMTVSSTEQRSVRKGVNGISRDP